MLVVGSSLVVQPAASLLAYASFEAEKVLINLEHANTQGNYEYLQGSACEQVPTLVERWLI